MILPSILDFLSQRIGLDAQSIGLLNVESALQERMRDRAIPDIGAYRDLLKSDDSEQEALIELVVVPETWFFRDQTPFDFLAVNARKRWGDGSPLPLRILSLPCSTGEEPYSIAMTLFDAGFAPGTFEIEAVDVSEKSLQHARAALYKKNDFRGRNLDVLLRYFTEEKPDVFQLCPKVRQTVRFSAGTLLNPPFLESVTTFHAIFCRNLLIYLNSTWRRHAVDVFRRLLRPDGILFVGHADATSALNAHFSMVRDASAFAYFPREATGTSAKSRTENIRIAPPIQTAPNRETILSELRAALENGREDRAIEMGEAALAHTRGDAELYFLLGMAHELRGEREAAREAWQKSLYLDPRHLNSLQRMKCLLEKEGDLEGAARIESRIRRDHPGQS